MAFTKVILPSDRMSRDAGAKENELHETLHLILKPASVVLEKIEPSLIKSYGKGHINAYISAAYASHASLQLEKQYKKEVIYNTLPKPPVEFGVLILLLLQNTISKSLTLTQLRNIICDLFPYYKTSVCDKYWESKLKNSTCGHFKPFFIKTRIVEKVHIIKEESPKKRGPGRPPNKVHIIKEESPKKRGPGRPPIQGNSQLQITLNSATRCLWETYLQNSIVGHEEQLRASTTQPNFLEVLLSGAAGLDFWDKSNYKGIKQATRVHNFSSVLGNTPTLANWSGDCINLRKLKWKKKTKNRVNTSYKLNKISGAHYSTSYESQGSNLGIQTKNCVEKCPILSCDDSPFVHVDSPRNYNKPDVSSSPSDGNQHSKTSCDEALPIVQLQSEAVSERDVQKVTQNIKTTLAAFLSTKRKGDYYYKVNKNSTSLFPATKRFCSSENPFGSSFVEASNNIIGKNLIQENISVGASLQTQFDVLSNNVQHAECQSNSPVQLKSNHSHVQAKINDLEIVRMTNDETARKEYLSNFGITDETVCNNLPVIKDVWSETSISGAVDGTQDYSLVNSQSGIMGIPIITEVTSLASVLNQEDENVYGQQAGITDVYSNSIDKCHNTENGSTAFVNIMHGNRQNPNELGCPNTSLTEDGRELQITKVCQTMDTSRRVQFHITGKRQYGQNSNDKSNKAATKISDVISGHALQNVSFVNQELSSNSKSGIISTNTSACSVSTSMTQNNPVSSFPQVSSCIDAWHKVFPWMLYREMDHSFLCRICEWGAAASECHTLCMVYTMKDSSDVLFVAGYLRTHQEAHFHKAAEHRKSLVITLFKSIYPFVRHSLYKGLQDLISYAASHNGGNFPGLQASQRGYFTTFMIMRIADYIEMDLLESLAKSPFFSITAVADKEFAILRWLNQKGEPEEHFFCSKISYPKEELEIRVYLQKKEVDMTKLISFTYFPSKRMNPSIAQISQLPVRYPPLSMLMKWLQKTYLLKDVFYHLETLTRLFRTTHPELTRFPEAAEIAKIKKPFSYGCLVNEKIMNFYFGAFNEIKNVCSKIYNVTRDIDAHSFFKLELKKSNSVQGCLSLILKLHKMFTKQDCSYEQLCKMLTELRSLVFAKMKSVENSDRNEYEVWSLFDLYLSHVIISLLTPEQKLADIFTRKLRHMTVNDVEKILTLLNSSYEGGSERCLHSLQSLWIQLFKNKDCSIFELLEFFATKQELCTAFPELFSFYQKVKVLPFLHADTGQYMFNLAVLEMLSSNKVEKQYIPQLSLIILEGPPVEDINIGRLLQIWSDKWKMNNL